MRSTIGIPAHNEERALPTLLESLSRQHLPRNGPVSVVVVANGCTDSTTQVAIRFGRQNWGVPRVVRDEALAWWFFGDSPYSFSVCEVAVASKSRALNIIHKTADSGVFLLFDADVRLGPGVIKAMHRAFLDFPQHGAVAVQYRGRIPPANKSRDCLSECCRLQVSRAINHFDQHSVRLDGKGCGYRHSLINRGHAKMIPVDMWLEGKAWRDSSGCVYLQDYYVEYVFPQTFQDLMKQYIRYSSSIDLLSDEYPDLVRCLRSGRRQVNRSMETPGLRHRVIGWLFLRWVDLRARNMTKYDEGEKWEAIQTTKGWN